MGTSQALQANLRIGFSLPSISVIGSGFNRRQGLACGDRSALVVDQRAGQAAGPRTLAAPSAPLSAISYGASAG